LISAIVTRSEDRGGNFSFFRIVREFDRRYWLYSDVISVAGVKISTRNADKSLKNGRTTLVLKTIAVRYRHVPFVVGTRKRD